MAKVETMFTLRHAYRICVEDLRILVPSERLALHLRFRKLGNYLGKIAKSHTQE